MNIEDRKRLIFEFLFSKTGLLRRYAAPEMLSADRQRDEINDMVADLNADIPSLYTSDDFSRLFEIMPALVRRRHGTRSWPTTKVLLAALKDALGEMKTTNHAGDVEGFMLDRLTVWYRKFGDQMPSCGSETRTAELIKRGVLTASEARKAGFDMSRELREQAVAEQKNVTIADMEI